MMELGALFLTFQLAMLPAFAAAVPDGAPNGAGLPSAPQFRRTSRATASSHYVRISDLRDVGSPAGCEVQPFTSLPEARSGSTPEHGDALVVERVRDKTLLFGLSLAAAVLFTFLGSRRWWLALFLAWSLFAGYQWVDAIREAWPLESREVSQAAVLGVILLPVLFYPANYYIHFVFLLPLVIVQARAREDAVAQWARPLSARNAGIAGYCF
jgi:hypothetical protein